MPQSWSYAVGTGDSDCVLVPRAQLIMSCPLEDIRATVLDAAREAMCREAAEMAGRLATEGDEGGSDDDGDGDGDGGGEMEVVARMGEGGSDEEEDGEVPACTPLPLPLPLPAAVGGLSAPFPWAPHTTVLRWAHG